MVIRTPTLGEYPTSISRLRVSTATNGSVVWEISAKDPIPKIGRVDLRLGDNPVMPEHLSHLTYEVVVPKSQTIFSLHAGIGYIVEVWDGKRSFVSSAAFSFPGARHTTDGNS